MKEFKVNTLTYFLFAFSTLLYLNTISFDYALDDKIVITENQFTKQGFAGIKDLVTQESMVGFFGRKKNLVAGGRYRPLALVTHAIEWELFGKAPGISHLINALLYGLNCILIFWFLKQLFSPAQEKLRWYSIALVAALVYAAHPLHTEVVANIKGRDDILSSIFGVAAMIQALAFYDSKKWYHAVLAPLLLILSLLSKEATVTFLAIIPISIWFFRPVDWKKVGITLIPLFVGFGIYMAIRYSVIGGGSTEIAKELMNNPFLNASEAEKYATIIYTFLLYIKLIIFPHPLTHDYYPKQIPILDFSDGLVLLSIAVHMVLLFYTVRLSLKKHPAGYGLLFYFITFSIYSNVVFPIGTFMNDRFMYYSSLGFAIILAYGLYWLVEKKKVSAPILQIGLVLLLLAYSAKTIARNFAWENDFTLSTTDVQVSSESAKNNMSAGLAYLDRAKEQKSEELKRKDLIQAVNYLQKSIEIYPTYMPPNLLMGNALTELKQYENARIYYERCLAINPEYGYAINNLERLGDLARKEKQYQQAEKAYTKLLEFTTKPTVIYDKLAELVGKDLGDPNRALQYINKGLELSPNDKDLLQKKGVVYAITGKPALAIPIFEKAYAQDTANARILLNIGIAYNNLGNTELGNKYIQRAFTKEPSLAKSASQP